MEEMDGEILERIYNRHKGEPGFIINTWEEWEHYVRKTYPVLIDVAKKEESIIHKVSHKELARGGLITYGDLGRLIELYSPDYFQLKIGAILGGCSEYEYEKKRPLISSIVVNESTQYPGRGFWILQGIPTHLRRRGEFWDTDPEEYMDEQMVVFWASEVKRVHEWWGNPDNDC
jgi:hypothetical protein